MCVHARAGIWSIDRPFGACLLLMCLSVGFQGKLKGEPKPLFCGLPSRRARPDFGVEGYSPWGSFHRTPERINPGGEPPKDVFHVLLIGQSCTQVRPRSCSNQCKQMTALDEGHLPAMSLGI